MAVAAMFAARLLKSKAYASHGVFQAAQATQKTPASALASSILHRMINPMRAYSSKGAGSDVIGIDLGTTNSCVAVMEGKPGPLDDTVQRFVKRERTTSTYQHFPGLPPGLGSEILRLFSEQEKAITTDLVHVVSKISVLEHQNLYLQELKEEAMKRMEEVKEEAEKRVQEVEKRAELLEKGQVRLELEILKAEGKDDMRGLFEMMEKSLFGKNGVTSYGSRAEKWTVVLQRNSELVHCLQEGTTWGVRPHRLAREFCKIYEVLSCHVHDHRPLCRLFGTTVSMARGPLTCEQSRGFACALKTLKIVLNILT